MDWRLIDQQEYLQGKQLKRKCFRESSRSDHVHCEFCWEKISDFENCVHEGYCTLDEKHWICSQCFQDFQEMFAWSIVV